MIRKPPATVQKQHAVVTAVETVAGGVVEGRRIARIAGRRAGSFVNAMILGWLAFACGLGALGSLAGGSIGGSIFGGGIAFVLGLCARRAFAKARGDENATLLAKASTSRSYAAAPGGITHTVNYSLNKLIVNGVGSAIFAGLAIGILPHTGGFLRVLCVIMAPTLLVSAVAIGFKAVGELAAIQSDAHGLAVHTLWRKRTLRWSDVADFGVDQIRIKGFYGLVTTSRIDLLVIHLRDGTKVKLTSRLLDMGPDGLPGVIAALIHARAGVVAPVPATAPEPARIDYLAEQARAMGPLRGGHPARAQFGRKLA